MMAYLVPNKPMGVDCVARFYDVKEDIVRDYVQQIRERGEEQQQAAAEENIK